MPTGNSLDAIITYFTHPIGFDYDALPFALPKLPIPFYGSFGR
ncbi:MAG: hypothetical protein NWT06_06200 [OM182 bacterium]|jgi:hypothetical protein|nr:hypothetical protein [OM182 bacterium]MDP4870786.1 hypothetical protein [Gammaproteobacteria bacterium]MDP4941615.1 hypothetical protein [OM182 bacterium]